MQDTCYGDAAKLLLVVEYLGYIKNLKINNVTR